MSGGLTTGAPFDYGTLTPEEELARQQATARVLSAVPAGIASSFYGDPANSDAKSYLPGALTGLYGIASLLGRGVQNAAHFLAPTTMKEPWETYKSLELPGGEEARDMAMRGHEKAMKDIAATPQSEGERVAQEAVATMSSVLPGLGMTTKGPAALQVAQQLLLPASNLGTKTALGLAGGLGALTGGVEAYTGPPPENGAEAQPPAPPAAVVPTGDVAWLPPDPTTIQAGPELSLRAALESSEWSWGDVILSTAAGIGIVAGGKRAIGMLRNYSMDRAIVQATAYNDDMARRVASPGLLTTPRVNVPGPPGVMASDKAVGYTLDRNAPLQRVMDTLARKAPEHVDLPPVPAPFASSHEMAKYHADVAWVNTQNTRLAEEAVANTNVFSMLSNEAAVNSRMQAFANTSVDPMNGKKYFPSIREHWDNIAHTLDDPQKAAYTRARNIADELDNRRNAGGTPHNFAALSNADLVGELANIRRNPALSRVLDERNLIARGMADWLQARGMLEAHEARALKVAHPNFMPNTNFRGIIDNPLSSRNLTPFGGIDEIPVHAHELDKQHFDALFRAVERNTHQTMIIRSVLNYQRQSNDVIPLIKEVKYTNALNRVVGEPDTDTAAIVVRIQGRLRAFEILDKDLFTWMDPARQPLANDVANEMRAWAQSGMTGVLSLTTGSLASVRIAAYNGVLSSIVRPPGIATGYLDRGAQRLTQRMFGTPTGIRGDFTGLTVAQPLAIAADIATHVADGFVTLLQPNNLWWANKFARKTFGDQAIDALLYNLKAAVARSTLTERRQLGITGSAGSGSAEQPGLQMGSLATSKPSPLNNLVPELFRAYDPSIPFTNIPIPIGRYIPAAIRVKEFVREIMQLISESHASAAYRLNRKQGTIASGRDWKLAREVRALTGDVGHQGSNVLAQYANQTIPYWAPTVQGARKFVNSASAHPFATAAGITNGLVLPALGAYFLARSNGDEAVEHLMKQTSSDRFASSMPLVMSPNFLTDRVDIPVDPTVRPFYVMALSIIHDTFGALHNSGEEGKKVFYDTMMNVWNKHITTETMGKIQKSIAGTIEPSLPPLAAAFAGGIDKALPQGWSAEVFNGSNPFMSTDKQRTIPGALTNIDPLTGANMSSSALKALTGLMAGFGFRMQGMYIDGSYAQNTAKSGPPGDRIAAFLGGVSGKWAQNARDNLGMFNGMLWKQETALAPRQPFVEAVEDKMTVLRDTAGVTNALRLDGQFTRSGVGQQDIPDMAQLQAKLPKDPFMLELYTTLGRVYNQANKMNQAAIDVRKQMDASKTTGAPANLQRTQQNIYVKAYETHMKHLATFLLNTEAAMSQRAGQYIRFQDINWNKGREQFTPLHAD